MVDQANISEIEKNAYLQRKAWRLLILIFLLCISIFGFVFVGMNYSNYIGASKIQSGDIVKLNITNCQINIRDLQEKAIPLDLLLIMHSQSVIHKSQVRKSKHLQNSSKQTIKSENDINGYIYYNIPGRISLPWKEQSSNISIEYKESKQQKNFTFSNILSTESCQVDLNILNPVSLTELQIDCYKNCHIIINSNLLKVRNFTLKGDNVQANILDFQTDYLNFNAQQGRFEANHIKVSKIANISIESGDAIYQSSQEFQLNWINSQPAFCFGGPYFSNPFIKGCNEATDQQIKEYLSEGKETQKDKAQTKKKQTSDKVKQTSEKLQLQQQQNNLTHNQEQEQINDLIGYNKKFGYFQEAQSIQFKLKKTHFVKQANETKIADPFPSSCFGNIMICHDKDCQSAKRDAPVINMKNKFGNIYANLIQNKLTPLNVTSDHVFHSPTHYQNNKLDWSLDTQKQIQTFQQLAKDPKTVDPTWIFKIGSKETLSNSYQQWQVTQNPAYTYMRPWWISTVSLTLMVTSQYFISANLNPGFCPYIPGLKLDDIYKTQLLVEKTFTNDSRALPTIAWQKKKDFPKLNYTHLQGPRNISTDKNQIENWINLKKVNDTTFKLNDIKLDSSMTTQYAFIISIILAFLIGLGLTAGLLYSFKGMIKQIMDYILQVTKYNDIQKSREDDKDKPIQESQKESKPTDREDQGLIQEQQKKQQSEQKSTLQSINNKLAKILKELPPASAFLDYLVQYIQKKVQNSAIPFYNNLFIEEIANIQQEKQNDDEVHEQQREKIKGTQMKTLYEKFCYLNQMRERKLDDEENADLLKKRGFKIITQQDALTQCYTHVKLNGIIPTINSDDSKPSMELFIKNCCQITKFDNDYEEADDFNMEYENFCIQNHLQKESLSDADLSQKYGIISTVKPQQWVVRIPQENNHKEQEEAEPLQEENQQIGCYQKFKDSIKSFLKKFEKPKKIFYIDRTKLENNFNIILERTDKIKNQEDLRKASDELILYNKWYLFDILTVFVHLAFLFILPMPIIAVIVLSRTQYAPYSLIPDKYLITYEDIIDNFWVLPTKLFYEVEYIHYIIIGILIYWIISTLDLIYYYTQMQFPIEQVFKKQTEILSSTNNNNIILKFLLRSIMWIFISLSILFIASYLSCCMVWLLLAAIVNPTAFLPYATASATFITVISSKTAEAIKLSSEGLDQVVKYVEQMAGNQINAMLKKVNLEGKLKGVIESDAVKNMAQQAAKLGVIDQQTLENMETKALQLASDPAKAAQEIGGQLEEFSKDPEAYAKKIAEAVEQKAIEMLENSVKQQFKECGQFMCGTVIAIMKNDKENLKYNIEQLLSSLYYTYSEKNALLEVFVDQNFIDLVWEFAFSTNPNLKGDDYINHIIDKFTQVIVSFLRKKNIYINNNVITKSITIINNVRNRNFKNFLDDLFYIVEMEDMPQLKGVGKFIKLIKFASHIFGEQGVSYQSLFQMSRQFILELDEEGSKQIVPSMDLLDYLLKVLRGKSKNISAKFIQMTIQRFLESLKLDQEQEKIMNSSVITIFISFMNNNFDNIPIEILNDVFQYMKKLKVVEIEKFFAVKGNSFMKQIKFLQQIYQVHGMLLNNINDDINNLDQIAQSEYDMHESAAEFYSTIITIKNINISTQNDLKILKSNRYFKKVAENLKIPSRVLQGLLALITTERGKDLIPAMKFLRLPFDYIKYIQIQRKLKMPGFFEKEELDKLGFQADNAPFDMWSNDEEIQKKQTQWYDSCKDSIEHLPVDNDELMQGGDTQAARKTLFTLKNKGQLIKFQQQLTSLQNQINKIGQLTKNEIEKLEQLINIRNIDDSGSSESRNAIIQLSKIFNIDKQKLELTLNLVLRPTQETIIQFDKQLIQHQHQSEEQQEQFVKFAENAVSKMQTLERQLDWIKTNKLLPIPKPLLINSFLYKKVKFTQNAAWEIFLSYFGKDGKYEQFEEYLPAARQIIGFMFSNMDCSDHTQFQSFFSQDLDKDDEEEQKVADKQASQQIEHDVDELHKDNSTNINAQQQSLNTENVSKDQLNKIEDKKDNQIKKDNIKAIEKIPKVYGPTILASMLCEVYKSNCQGIFLDYFNNMLMNCKKNNLEKDYQKYESFLLFSCLLIFFNGESEDVYFQYNGQDTSIVNHLCEKLELPLEFFQVIYLDFSNNVSDFVDKMLKFMRRLKYMEIQKAEQEKQKDSKQTVAITIPFQSLVNIPPKIVENCIGLLNKNGEFSCTFVANSMKLKVEEVEFISFLKKLKFSQGEKEVRHQYYSQINKNKSIVQILNSLKIDIKEFTTILSIVMNDYELKDLTSLLSNLQLKEKVSVKPLKQLLQLSRAFPQGRSNSKKHFTQLSTMMQQMDILDKQMDLNYQWVTAAKQLMQCDVFSLNELISQNFPHLQYMPNVPTVDYNSYICMLQGLFGFVSYKDSKNIQKTSIYTMFDDLYNQLDPAKYEDLSRWHKNGFLPENEQRDFIICCMSNKLHMNPLWVALFMFDEDAWNYLRNCSESDEKNRNYICPEVVYALMLQFITSGSLGKESLTNYEFFNTILKMSADYTIQVLSGLFEYIQEKDYKRFSNKEECFCIGLRFLQQFAFLQPQCFQSDQFSEIRKQHPIFQFGIEHLYFDENNYKSDINDKIVEMLKDYLIEKIEQYRDYEISDEQWETSVQNAKDELYNFFNSAENYYKILEIYDQNYQDDEYLSSETIKLLRKNENEVEQDFSIWLLQNIFTKVAQLFEDPRLKPNAGMSEKEKKKKKEQDQKKKKGKNQEQDINDKIFTHSEIYSFFEFFNPQDTAAYQLSLLSELTALRYNKNGVPFQNQIYFPSSQNEEEDSEEQRVLLNYKIDYSLSLIEKYLFLHSSNDFFSRFRLGPMLGLSAGVLFGIDELLDTYPPNQLISPEFVMQLSNHIQKNQQDKKSIEQINSKFGFKLQWLWNNILKKGDTAKAIGKQTGLIRQYKSMEEDVRIYLNYGECFELFQDHEFSDNFEWKHFAWDCSDSEQFFKQPGSIVLDGKPYEKFQRIKQIQNLEKDVRSGINVEGLTKYKNQFQDLLSSTSLVNFQLVLELLGKKYEAISKPDSFFSDQQYGKEVKLYQSFLMLQNAYAERNYQNIDFQVNVNNNTNTNASQIGDGNSANANDLHNQQRIDRLREDIGLILSQGKSDSNAVTEILSYFLDINCDLNIVCQNLQNNKEMFQSLLYVCMNPDKEQNGSQFYTILDTFSISQEDKETISSIIDKYNNGSGPVFNMIQMSSSLKANSGCWTLLEFIRSYDRTLMHQQKDLDWQGFQFRAKMAAGDYNNNKMILNTLWNIAKSVCIPVEQYYEDQFDKIFIQKDRNLEVYHVLQVVQNIISDSYQFLFERDEYYEFNQSYQPLLQMGLLHNDDQFTKIQSLSILQPDKINGTHSQFSIDSYLNIIYGMLNLESQSKKHNELAQGFVYTMYGIAEGNFMKIIQGLSLNKEQSNIPKLLQSILVWRNITKLDQMYDQNQKMLFGNSLLVLPMYLMSKLNAIGIKKGDKIEDIQKSYQKVCENLKCDYNFLYDLESQEQYENNIDNESNKPSWFFWCYNLDPFFDELKNSNNIYKNEVVCMAIRFFTGSCFKEIALKKSGEVTRFCFDFFEQGYYIVNRFTGDQKDKILEQIRQLPSLSNVIINNFPKSIPQQLYPYLAIIDQFIQLFSLMQMRSRAASEPKMKANLGMYDSALKQFLIELLSFILNIAGPNQQRDNKNQQYRLNLINSENQDIIKKIFFLLTGYNLDDVKAQPVSELNEKLKTLILIIDQSILSEFPTIHKYIDSNVLLTMLDCLKSLSDISVKALMDKEFLLSVKNLLYVISGQPLEIKNNDQSGQAGQSGQQAIQDQQSMQLVQKNKPQQGNNQIIQEKFQREPLIILPISLIEIVFDLLMGDHTKIFDFLKKMQGVDENKINFIQKAVEEVEKLGIFSGGKISFGGIISKKSNSNSDEITKLMQRINEGKANTRDLFKAIDNEGDSSGSISKKEFNNLSQRLGMNLTDHRIDEIFSDIKKGKSLKQDSQNSNSSNNNDLNEEEFEKAMGYLQNKTGVMSLEALGISKELLIFGIIYLAVILLLIFVFIFLGIQAFALGGGFGSVINSLMAMGAGSGAKNAQEDKSEKTKPEVVKESVEENKAILESATL